MTTQHTAVQEIALLAKSLRQQVADSRSPHTNKGRRKGAGQPNPSDNQLHENLMSLLELVDLLDEAVASEPINVVASSADSAPLPAPVAGLSAEQMLDTLDRGLAGWQSKISLAYANGASQELADHLKLVELLTESLQGRENRLESQRQQLEQSLTAVLHREARTARQRAVIAQDLRTKKAEWLLEADQQLRQRTDQIRQELLLECDQTQPVDNSETESLRSELESLQSELESLRSEDESLRNESDSLRSELEETLERLQVMSSLDGAQADKQHELIMELEEQVARANSELAQLQEQLESQSETPLLIEAQTDTIAELKTELESAKQQLQDLHQQNSDLAAAVAKHQVLSSGNTPHVSFQQESLSWEERKKLIMAQLEEETEGDEALSDEQVELHLEIEQVLLSTELEIAKRDREIAELHTIVEQQSDTRQGVAIGAAAFAQAFDNDEMIQQERLKLKEIQREWEEKLRQAEIDVSLERARLSRERLQLESELENARRDLSVADKEPEKAKKRKWLEHLGLRDENRG